MHFNAKPQAAELRFRTVHAAIPLSVYGAVSYGCNNQYEQGIKLGAERGR